MLDRLIQIFAFFALTRVERLIFLVVILFPIALYASLDRRLGIPQWHRALWIGLFGFITFCIYGFAVTNPSPEREVDHYVALGARGLFAGVIVGSAAAICLPILAWILAIAYRFASVSYRSGIALIQPPTSSEPASVTSFDPMATTRAALDQARQEYEAECENLRFTGLDDIELESALLRARQKYVRKVHAAQNT